MFSLFRWVVAIILLVFFLGCAVTNVAIVVRFYIARKRASLIPFVGGLSGVVGLVVAPGAELRSYWWIPAVADLGAAPLLAGVVASYGWSLGNRWFGRDRAR